MLSKQAGWRSAVILMVLGAASAMCGCHAGFSVVMEIREGDQSACCLSDVSRVEQTAGAPIAGAVVRFWRYSRGRRLDWPPRKSDDDGSLHYHMILPGPGQWYYRKKRMHFACAKEGFRTVKGSFVLGEFTYRPTDKRIFVFMERLSDSKQGAAGRRSRAETGS